MNDNAISTGDDDRAIFQAFAPGADDATGLLAYALHRQARWSFDDAFRLEHGRAPDPAEWRGFLAGEITPPRIAGYRTEAARLIGGATASPKKKRPGRWPLFGLFPESMTHPPAEGRVNWRGLIIRLVMLLAAVILTAILLRILFVRA